MENFRLLPAFIIIFLCVRITAQPLAPKNGTGDTNPVLLSYDRYIQPAGRQIVFGDPGFENHALDCSLSPDEKWLVVEERLSLVFINTSTGNIDGRLALGNVPELKGLMNTYSGIQWQEKDGHLYVWWSAAGGGTSLVMQALWDGDSCFLKKKFSYPALPPATLALPNEVLIRNESGKDYLYVVLNGNNRIIKQDAKSGDTVWITEAGVAPYGLTLADNKLYVTNWGGRIPGPGDTDVAGVPWGNAHVDPNTGATSEGSVSVIDPGSGSVLATILTGLHPNEITSSPDGMYVYLTNSNSDEVTVINTSTGSVSETITVRLQPGINPYFGDSPDGLCVSGDGKYLYVTNGMDNAIAVIRLGKLSSAKGKGKTSLVEGFIPTGAYPSSVVLSGNGVLYVTNLEGDGKFLSVPSEDGGGYAYNSHHMLTSVSVIENPRKRMLRDYTKTVIAVNRLARLEQAGLPPRPGIMPVPVPERIGEPSVFKHVLYIIRENRTYDQILGDNPAGDGDSTLCIFGKQVTPNAHKLSEQFILMDNFAVAGKCSAEGHQWTDASIVTDYIEKNMRAWFRSYPHVQTDALVYAPSGFLWDNAVKHHKSVTIYGEAAIPVFDNSLSWRDIYTNHLNKVPFVFTNKTTIAPVRELLSTSFPGYDSHKIADQIRADAFIAELNACEKAEGDQLPELMIMALPNDHTSGTRPGFPTPRAAIADNDLALGRIVEAISKSRFWKETVIFVTEDDSQNGWDHLSPYRTVGFVLSPYSMTGSVLHTPYNQQAMVRTIEQILGLPPMNIEDAIATPMSDCFVDSPKDSFYQALPNLIPLDELNPPLSALSGQALHFARQSLHPDFDRIDSGRDDALNRILWFSMQGNKPYPSKYAGDDEDDGEEEAK